MHAEVMAIGDELTSGERLDTNSQWLSQELAQIGVAVRFHTTVGDDLAALTAALQVAAGRAPLVLITGGLGPTADDLTREAIAAASQCPLELRAEALDVIRSRFANLKRRMPDRNRQQAMFPQGSLVIPNPHGTAPGVDLNWATEGTRCRLFALPGVPAEMVEMWNETVRPAIATLAGSQTVIRHHRIKCFGAGESHFESMLPDLIRRDRQPRVGITVHRATITLRITASGPDDPACRRLMEPTIRTIHDCLEDLVFGEEDDELEHVVVRLLEQTRQRLAVCEWGTSGLITNWLGAVDTSQRLAAGLVISDIDSLQSLSSTPVPLNDPPAIVRWMAETLRERFATDLALAVGCLPHSGADDPRIHLGLATPQDSVVVSRAFRGHPDIVLDRAAKQALDLVRRELIRNRPAAPSSDGQ